MHFIEKANNNMYTYEDKEKEKDQEGGEKNVEQSKNKRKISKYRNG